MDELFFVARTSKYGICLSRDVVFVRFKTRGWQVWRFFFVSHDVLFRKQTQIKTKSGRDILARLRFFFLLFTEVGSDDRLGETDT